MSAELYKRSRGIVLLLTLVLLALASILMATAVRQAVEQALVAADARMEMQRRWGGASIEGAIEAVPSIFADIESSGENIGPVISPRCSLVLGEFNVELIFTDEQGKANLNQAILNENRFVLEKRLRGLAQQYRGYPFIRLEPIGVLARQNDRISEEPDMSRPLVAWSQVTNSTLTLLAEGDTGRPHIMDVATLWGSGRLNLHRASPESIDLALGAWLRPSQRKTLRQGITDESPPALSEISNYLDLDEKQREEINLYFTESEACYGVWMIFRDERRAWYSFTVEAKSSADIRTSPSRFHRIVWP